MEDLSPPDHSGPLSMGGRLASHVSWFSIGWSYS